MKTKTQQAIDFFKVQKYKKAYKIFKTFKRSFDKEENRTITITYESLCDVKRKVFYESLEIDVNEMINKAKEIIKNKYKLC
jgi:hypothetical protein